MKKKSLLADLVKMDNPDNVLSEIKIILKQICPNFDFYIFESTWNDLIKLYRGEYSGYKACSTYYHDLQHTTDCVIALTRLIHGAYYSGQRFSDKEIEMGLISALFHDVGYIVAENDATKNGGSYTATHIARGIQFIREYMEQRDYSQQQIQDCSHMMLCTGLENHIPDIPFNSEKICTMGKMLGSADLIGQMGDRTYLEKLPFLYREFLDAGLGTYQNEFDFFQKSLKFYTMIQSRLNENLDKYYLYSHAHFKHHYGIDKDLYMESIENNMNFLDELLNKGKRSFYQYLKRGGRMQQLRDLDLLMNRVVH